MNSKIVLIPTVLVLSLVLFYGLTAYATQVSSNRVPVARSAEGQMLLAQAAKGKAAKEQMHQIHTAKQHLSEANRIIKAMPATYSGHRAAASKHIDEALYELDECLKIESLRK